MNTTSTLPVCEACTTPFHCRAYDICELAGYDPMKAHPWRLLGFLDGLRTYLLYFVPWSNTWDRLTQVKYAAPPAPPKFERTVPTPYRGRAVFRFKDTDGSWKERRVDGEQVIQVSEARRQLPGLATAVQLSQVEDLSPEAPSRLARLAAIASFLILAGILGRIGWIAFHG